MKKGPKSVDQYLAALSADQRAALARLRSIIKASVPDAEEGISYQLPAFRLRGKYLVAFGAAARHCALYPGSAPIEACGSELRAFDTSKGTIRFDPKKPLPAALVRKLLRVCVARIPAAAPRPRPAPARRA